MNKSPAKHHLDREPTQYLDLWKWFSDDAAKIKDRMWTMTTFFYTVLGALAGFAAKKITTPVAGERWIAIEDPVLVLVVAIVGLTLSYYGRYMIKEYGLHLRSGWNRANYIRHRINGFDDIWHYGDAEFREQEEKRRHTIDRSIPKVTQRLMVLMSVFGVLFGILLLAVLLAIGQG